MEGVPEHEGHEEERDIEEAVEGMEFSSNVETAGTED